MDPVSLLPRLQHSHSSLLNMSTPPRETSLSPITPLDLDAGNDVPAVPSPPYSAAPVYYSRGLSLSIPNAAPVPALAPTTQHMVVNALQGLVTTTYGISTSTHSIGQNQVALMRQHGVTSATLEHILETTQDISESVDDLASVLDALTVSNDEEFEAARNLLERIDTRTLAQYNALAANETNVNLARVAIGNARDDITQLSSEVASLRAAADDNTIALASLTHELDQHRADTVLGIADLARTGDAIRGHIADLAGAMAQVVTLMQFPGAGPTTGHGAPPPPPPPTPAPSPVAVPSTLAARSTTMASRAAPYSVPARHAKVTALNRISVYFHRPALASVEPDELQDDVNA